MTQVILYGCRTLPDISCLSRCPQLCSISLIKCGMASLTSLPASLQLVDINVQVHTYIYTHIYIYKYNTVYMYVHVMYICTGLVIEEQIRTCRCAGKWTLMIQHVLFKLSKYTLYAKASNICAHACTLYSFQPNPHVSYMYIYTCTFCLPISERYS